LANVERKGPEPEDLGPPTDRANIAVREITGTDVGQGSFDCCQISNEIGNMRIGPNVAFPHQCGNTLQDRGQGLAKDFAGISLVELTDGTNGCDDSLQRDACAVAEWHDRRADTQSGCGFDQGFAVFHKNRMSGPVEGFLGRSRRHIRIAITIATDPGVKFQAG